MSNNVDVTAMLLRHPDSRIFHIHIQPGGSHTRLPPSMNSQKTAKSAIPHPAGHTLQPMPHRSPCASDLHTGHIPYRHSLTRRSPRPARFLAGLQSIHGGSSRQLTLYQPRPAFGSLKPAHPAGFPQIPCTNGGEAGAGAWHGIASRRGADVAVGPCIQARLKTGNCGADLRGAGAGWTRQKPADAAPDRAERIADHAGRRPDSASRMRYAVGVDRKSALCETLIANSKDHIRP